MKKTELFDQRKSGEIIYAILVGIDDGKENVDLLLDELSRLLSTAGGQEYARIVQKRDKPNPNSCIGSGKVRELRTICENSNVTLVVFDTELSPTQIKNLEDALGNEIRVIDRSMLILDIFALHAVTGEGKLQVELAQLEYTVPRIFGKGSSLSRQGGGIIAMRGPGETKLETDKRHIRRRIKLLENELESMERSREIKRSQRNRSGLMRIAIAGYTNAGKSTLLNYLTDAGILAENKLFATLDPTTRKFTLPSGTDVLITDTVGFIRKLPHHLIKAFKSTLDEVITSDIVMVVTDCSDVECQEHLNVTKKLMNELGVGDKPIIYVFNKCDLLPGSQSKLILDASANDTIYISAHTGEGISSLISRIQYYADSRGIFTEFFIPNENISILSELYKSTSVNEVRYFENGIYVKTISDEKTRGKYSHFIKHL